MVRHKFPWGPLKFRLVVVIGMMLIIAAVHLFRLGSYFSGSLYRLYYSYASDLMLPFGSYFLLSINEISMPILRSWVVKAIMVFTVMSLSEVMQYFGIYFFGTTFDLVDVVMYAIGVLLAVFLDKVVFARLFPLWLYDEE